MISGIEGAELNIARNIVSDLCPDVNFMTCQMFEVMADDKSGHYSAEVWLSEHCTFNFTSDLKSLNYEGIKDDIIEYHLWYGQSLEGVTIPIFYKTFVKLPDLNTEYFITPHGRILQACKYKNDYALRVLTKHASQHLIETSRCNQILNVINFSSFCISY